jgi:DNA-binding GntR family transcriptional regulator
MSFATKQDQVAAIIRERIIIGDYPRGQKLKQADIAADLAVSITPVREALLMLMAEGYVKGLPHKGLLVPEVDLSQLREIYDLRLMLERELTAIALSRITPGRLQEMMDTQRSVEAAAGRGDLQAVRKANYHFHFNLYEMADRPQTFHFIRILWAKYPFTLQDQRPGRPSRMCSEHDAFLEKVRQDDLAGAVEAMAEHIRGGWREINSDNDTLTRRRRPAPERA